MGIYRNGISIHIYIYNNYIHTQTTNNNVIIMGQNCDSNHKILWRDLKSNCWGCNPQNPQNPLCHPTRWEWQVPFPFWDFLNLARSIGRYFHYLNLLTSNGILQKYSSLDIPTSSDVPSDSPFLASWVFKTLWPYSRVKCTSSKTKNMSRTVDEI